MNCKNIFIIITLVFLLYACGFNSTKYYTPTEVNVNESPTSIENLMAGRSTYINVCGECHKLYKPSRYNKSDWKIYMDDMQERAEISNKEKQQVLDYLTSEITE